MLIQANALDLIQTSLHDGWLCSHTGVSKIERSTDSVCLHTDELIETRGTFREGAREGGQEREMQAGR